jgi:hypothetical protein
MLNRKHFWVVFLLIFDLFADDRKKAVFKPFVRTVKRYFGVKRNLWSNKYNQSYACSLNIDDLLNFDVVVS